MIVFGSANFDITVKVPALPDIGAILPLDSATTCIGGKGANQAVAAARAGAPVKFYGTVGSDPFGDAVLPTLRRENISVEGVKRTSAMTGLALIISEAGGQRSIYMKGANSLLTADAVPDSDLTPGALIVMQGDIPMAENERLIVRAKERGCVIVLTLGPFSPISEQALSCVSYLIMNESESQSLAECLRLGGTVEDIARTISGRFGCTTVITLGERGAMAVDRNGKKTACNPFKVDAVDAVGAGDTFTGFLAAAVERGEELEKALGQANIAAALACTKVGAQSGMPLLSDVQHLLRTGRSTGK